MSMIIVHGINYQAASKLDGWMGWDYLDTMRLDTDYLGWLGLDGNGSYFCTYPSSLVLLTNGLCIYLPTLGASAPFSPSLFFYSPHITTVTEAHILYTLARYTTYICITCSVCFVFNAGVVSLYLQIIRRGKRQWYLTVNKGALSTA